MIARDVYEKYKFPILMSFSLCFLMFMPLIMNGVYYIDDMGRSIRAEPAWARNGRPVADYVTWALNFGGKIQDISPISQLLAVGLLALTAVMIARKYIGNYGVLSMLTASAFILSPFMMENMAFQYDAFPMLLAFLISALPFLLVRSGGIVRFSLICIASVFISLNLYQASLCVFLVFMTLGYLFEVKKGNNKDAFLMLIVSSLSILIAYFIYCKFVVPHVISGDYNISKSQSVPFKEPLNAIRILIYNACLFRDLMLTAISPMYMATMSPLVIGFIYSFYKLLTSIKRDKFRFITIVIVACSPMLLAFFVVGPMLFLKDPLFRPRVMLGFAAFTVSIAVISNWHLPSCINKARVLLIVPAVYVIGMNYTFANALENQHDYERFVISHIISDAYSQQVQDTNKISFNGWIGLSPIVKVAIDKYPSLEILVTRLLHDDNGWGWIQLQHFGLNKPFPSTAQFKSIESNVCDSQFIKRSNYYNVYKKDDVVIIDFDKKCSN